MDVIKKHTILTAIAVTAGIAAVFWLRPATDGGTVFIVAICLILANGIGAIVGMVCSRVRLPRLGPPQP
jgi:hypothetical protein